MRIGNSWWERRLMANSLCSKSTKNPDVSTGPLAHSHYTAHSFACSALLASLRALLRSFITSLAHSLPSSRKREWLMLRNQGVLDPTAIWAMYTESLMMSDDVHFVCFFLFWSSDLRRSVLSGVRERSCLLQPRFRLLADAKNKNPTSLKTPVIQSFWSTSIAF